MTKIQPLPHHTGSALPTDSSLPVDIYLPDDVLILAFDTEIISGSDRCFVTAICQDILEVCIILFKLYTVEREPFNVNRVTTHLAH